MFGVFVWFGKICYKRFYILKLMLFQKGYYFYFIRIFKNMNYNLYNIWRENFLFYYNCFFKKLFEGFCIYNMCV